jgi:hypothetical protein
MKRTFAVKLFRARAYRPGALAGPMSDLRYRAVRAAMFVAGAVSGGHFLSGIKIGHHYHSGAIAGIKHG